MATTRSMTTTQNHDDDEASNKKRFMTCDNCDLRPWSYLHHDVLYLVMMQLGIIDFISFSGVCKAWRSLALSNRKLLMASRPPMSLSISTDANEKECCLEDFEGRKFKTILPHSAGRLCIGLTCGYLILMGIESHDFWLVNPITTHELHFPAFPYFANTNPETKYRHLVKGILVFSPSINGWVFVMLNRNKLQIWFSIAGKGAWNLVSSDIHIFDIHAFRGRIYALNIEFLLYEMRLNPDPELTLLETMNFPQSAFNWHVGFASSCENLYVVYHNEESIFGVDEVDFGKMQWVSEEKTIGEYVIFQTILNHSSVAIKLESWADSQLLKFRRYAKSGEKGRRGRVNFARIWYFPHDCLNV